jgi:hypothetical protein
MSDTGHESTVLVLYWDDCFRAEGSHGTAGFKSTKNLT